MPINLALPTRVGVLLDFTLMSQFVSKPYLVI
jgi:hypothetical protein